MKIPRIIGNIDRRILINYQVEKDVLSKYLPNPFRPKIVNGKGMAGICLIRLKGSIKFDNALLMKKIEHEWHSLKEIKSGFH
jgi:hypothetical protein